MSQNNVDKDGAAESAPQKLSLPISFLAGGIASCMAVTVTNPIEVVKTRLQLQGELQAAKETKKVYTGVLQSFGLIARTEGIKGLQRGLISAYFYQICLNGCRLGLYEPVRHALNDMAGIAPGVHNYYIGIASGALTGVMGATLGSPLYLVKVRMQSFSSVRGLGEGEQTRYRSTLGALKQLWRQGGLRGLFKGVNAAMVRTGAGSSVQLPIYHKTKQILDEMGGIPEGPLKHAIAGTCAGFGVAIVMNPFDVVMTRMYNQVTNKYTGVLDCIFKSIKTEGPMALYKGFIAQGLRVGPHTLLTLMFMEQTMKVAKKVEGVPF